MSKLSLRLYNSLSRSKETFEKNNDEVVTMYTCGPTVYSDVTIGNFRTYVLSDFVYRTLGFCGYTVRSVMNITDVGHLVSDADEGEDKMAKGAEREGLNMWQIAAKYTGNFLDDARALEIIPADVLARATDHIQEQIALVKKLEQKGYAYVTSDGVYFDTSKVGNYGAISDLRHDDILEGKRVGVNKEKRNPTDFALWKIHKGGGRREMEWESPWGVGFPGWHIECSAMALRHLTDAYNTSFALTESIDLHIGGEDLKMTHHPNEIAQSEAATGTLFVRFWLHGAFLTVNSEKISKSKGNAILLRDIKDKGIHPLALRYLYTSTHYRKQMHFTWESLRSAESALMNLYEHVVSLSVDPSVPDTEYLEKFSEALCDDINIPQAVAVMWDMLGSDLPDDVKLATIFQFDTVLGLQMQNVWTEHTNIPHDIRELVEKREVLRLEKQFKEADALRDELLEKGYMVKDTETGPRVLRGFKD